MVNATTAQAAPELPVEEVERLSTELAHALDAWKKHTNIEFIAHVHPASSGKGVWLENSKVGEWIYERAKGNVVALDTLLAAHTSASKAFHAVDFTDVDTAEPEWEAKEAAERAVIIHPCKTIDDVRRKARLALSDEDMLDSLQNCTFDGVPVLVTFLRSVLGEDAE